MTLLNLPEEIILKILASSCIDLASLANVALTCRQLYELVQNSNDLWRQKFRQKWPMCPVGKFSPCVKSWRDEYKFRLTLKRELYKFVKSLSAKFYPNKEFSLYFIKNHLGKYTSKSPDTLYLTEELFEIILYGSRVTRLTERYYAKKVLANFRRLHLCEDWREYWDLPEEARYLEDGAVLVSQWMRAEHVIQPSKTEVREQLEDLCARVQDHVKARHPDIKLPPKSKPDEKKVLQSINQILFINLGFAGNVDNYYSPQNSYIDKVLETKKGIPITLCVLYHAVARRLGVICEPVNFPRHFLLRWEQFPEKQKELAYSYIDAFAGGAILTPHECLRLSGRSSVIPEDFNPATTREVLERMVRNLMQDTNWLDTQRLYLAISPGDADIAAQFAQNCCNTGLEDGILYLQQHNFQMPAGMLEELQLCLENSSTLFGIGRAPLRRRDGSTTIEHAVGVVMHHRRYNYDCVITGWDPVCSASELWIHQMGVRRLPRGANQPFYHVLVQDGTTRYAAEENLLMCQNPHFVAHDEIGIYFQEFDGTRYISNAENRAQYPDDDAYAAKLVAERLHPNT